MSADIGARLLAETMSQLTADTLISKPQNHKEATFTKKISKEDGLIDINGDSKMNYRKYRAYYGWPGTYFFIEKNNKKVRVAIKEAILIDSKFTINKVVPENGREMSAKEFKNGYRVLI